MTVAQVRSSPIVTRNRGAKHESLLEMLNTNTPSAKRALQESKDKMAKYRKERKEAREEQQAERKRVAEERRKALEEKNQLAKENEEQRERLKDQKRKASEAALERLITSRKKARKN